MKKGRLSNRNGGLDGVINGTATAKSNPLARADANGRGGARSALVGSLLPFGAGLSGMFTAATGGNERALMRQRRTSTAIGAVTGGLYGAMVGTAMMPVVGTAIGAASGTLSGAAVNYGLARGGAFLGKKLKKK
jgi:hypothetical protein